jgi:hypothetical protein
MSGTGTHSAALLWVQSALLRVKWNLARKLVHLVRVCSDTCVPTLEFKYYGNPLKDWRTNRHTQSCKIAMFQDLTLELGWPISDVTLWHLVLLLQLKVSVPLLPEYGTRKNPKALHSRNISEERICWRCILLRMVENVREMTSWLVDGWSMILGTDFLFLRLSKPSVLLPVEPILWGKRI